MIICIYDVTEYGSCMIDDLLFDMLDDYNFDMFYDYSFERIFRNYFHFPQKKIVLTVRLILFTFRYQVSTIYKSNFWCSTVWDDIWLSFANEQKNFRTQNYFRQEIQRYFNDENTTELTFFVHSFLRKAWSLSLRWNKILEKGDGLLCQILIILQC